MRGSEYGKACCRWRQRDGGDVTCGKWQWGLWPLGPVASDGNVSWHVRAGPCTPPSLLSRQGKQSAQQMAECDKNAIRALVMNDVHTHTNSNEARVC